MNDSINIDITSRYQLCLVCKTWNRLISEAPGVVDELTFEFPCFREERLRLLQHKSRTRLDSLEFDGHDVSPLEEEAEFHMACGLASSLEVRHLSVSGGGERWWKNLWMFTTLHSLSCEVDYPQLVRHG